MNARVEVQPPPDGEVVFYVCGYLMPVKALGMVAVRRVGDGMPVSFFGFFRGIRFRNERVIDVLPAELNRMARTRSVVKIHHGCNVPHP